MDHQNHEKLISEKDGSEIAGVSAETLRQYRSIGILQGVERAGEVFYSRDELAAVFFIRPQQPSREHGFQPQNVSTANFQPASAEPLAQPGTSPMEAGTVASTATVASSSTSEATKFTTSPVSIGEISPETLGRLNSASSGPIHTGPAFNQAVTDPFSAKVQPTVFSKPADIDPPYQQPETKGSGQSVTDKSVSASSEPERMEAVYVGQLGQEPSKPAETTIPSTAAGQSIGGNEGNSSASDRAEDVTSVPGSDHRGDEVDSLELPYPIQSISASRVPATIDPETSQLTRSLREQIEMLREERDWLRTRLEKLELRYEREQMILLSENDTVRTLISQLGKPKRKWWHALPWLKSDDQKR